MENRESPIFDQPRVEQGPFGLIRFSSNGLIIDVQRNDLSMVLRSRTTKQWLRIIRGMMIGTVDFYPFGPAPLKSRKYTTLAKFIRGLNDFFAHFNDPGSDNFPRYLVGGVGLTGVDPQMARFLEKSFGCLVDDTGGRLAVAEQSLDVKERLDKISQNQSLIDRILKSAEREQLV
ncbi:hypothetical protein HYW42_02580 [Candidatus Daviesbacteria bacterium]|nr:hypothetical protein [Candidatus Daviesbacteria bacterium]